MGKKLKFYGNGKFSKGQVIHKHKSSAEAIAKSCRAEGIPYRIRKLKKGYRVDKKW